MKKIYIWKKNGVLSSTNGNIYLNEEWIVEVEFWTWQENLCKDFGLKDLYKLYKKYFSDELKVNIENENILKKQIEDLQKEVEILKKEKSKDRKPKEV